MKKILTALLIGAFVFGVGVADMNFESTEKVFLRHGNDKDIYGDKHDGGHNDKDDLGGKRQ